MSRLYPSPLPSLLFFLKYIYQSPLPINAIFNTSSLYPSPLPINAIFVTIISIAVTNLAFVHCHNYIHRRYQPCFCTLSQLYPSPLPTLLLYIVTIISIAVTNLAIFNMSSLYPSPLPTLLFPRPHYQFKKKYIYIYIYIYSKIRNSIMSHLYPLPLPSQCLSNFFIYLKYRISITSFTSSRYT